MQIREETERSNWDVYEKTLYKVNFFGLPYGGDLDYFHVPVGRDYKQGDKVIHSNGDFILLVDHKRPSAFYYKEEGYQNKAQLFLYNALCKTYPQYPAIYTTVESSLSIHNDIPYAILSKARPIDFWLNYQHLDVKTTKIKGISLDDLSLRTILELLEKDDWKIKDELI